MTQLVTAFGAALTFTLLLTPLVRRFAWRLKIVDRADGLRKLHGEPIPLGGGVVLMLALAAITLANCGGAPLTWPGLTDGLPLPVALVLSSSMMCLVGCCDDLKALRVRWKLLGQVLATLPLVLAGHRLEQLEIGGLVIELGWWAVPLSIGWLITGANALNFVDGIDGLASTIGIAIAVAIALIAHQLGHAEVAVLCAILGGGLGGFLFYNWQPATIFLGDAGSMVIGLWLAALAVAGGRSPEVGSRLVVLVSLLIVPIADIGLAVIRRTLSGTQFWLPDRAHIHHRLLDRGLTVPKTVDLLAGICVLSGCAAFAAAVNGRELLAWGGLALLGAVMARSRYFGQAEVELAGRALARCVLMLAARLSNGRLTRALPSLAELEQMQPSIAWAMFVAEIELHSVERLELTLADHRGEQRRHDWEAASGGHRRPESCTLEVASDSASQCQCRLRALLCESQAADPLNWLSLLDVLQLFGRHWSAHPEQIPVSSLSIAEGGRLTIASPAGDDLRRAA